MRELMPVQNSFHITEPGMRGLVVFRNRIVLLLLLLLSLSCLSIPSVRAGAYEDALSSARLGDTKQLTDLLKKGVLPDTVDADGNTLLMYAVIEGHVDTVKAVLQFHPDVNLRNASGDSALMMAALKGENQIIPLLLDAGAEQNYAGWTPLIYAAFSGHLDTLNLLLDRGADVNALAPNRSNALMFAARNGHIDIVRRLLETKIDLDQINDRGFTAETWAVDAKNTDIADLIVAERKKRAKHRVLQIDL